jgi:hypothetical protein
MKELKALDPDNKKYYLMDNARVHKSKSFYKYLEKNIMGQEHLLDLIFFNNKNIS